MYRRIQIAVVTTVLSCALLFTGAAGGGKSAGSDKKVLATVNGDAITAAELRRYASFLQSSRKTGALTEAERRQMREQSRRAALKQLIERRLVVQAAKKEFFGEKKADKALSRIGKQQIKQLERNLGSPIRLREFLRSQGVSRQEFIRMRREAMLIQEYLRKKVEQQIYVPPWKMRRYYREHREDYRHPRTVVFRQIWVNAGGGEGRDKAERILRKIRSGASFAAMANKYGSSGTSHPGGRYELKGQENMRDWLKKLLKRLEPGDVSDVVKRPIGYCIVKLEKWEEAGRRSFEDVADRIRRRLRRKMRKKKRRRLMQNLRSEATIEYRAPARALLGNGPSRK